MLSGLSAVGIQFRRGMKGAALAPRIVKFGPNSALPAACRRIAHFDKSPVRAVAQGLAATGNAAA
jgi:hypothetical protein